jgi:hypothetical protein
LQGSMCLVPLRRQGVIGEDYHPELLR